MTLHLGMLTLHLKPHLWRAAALQVPPDQLHHFLWQRGRRGRLTWVNNT